MNFYFKQYLESFENFLSKKQTFLRVKMYVFLLANFRSACVTDM